MEKIDFNIEIMDISITHWENILIGKDKGFSGDDCALCLYQNNECKKCPLVTHGNAKRWCNSTPYESFNSHVKTVHDIKRQDLGLHNIQSCPGCERLVKEQIDYLKYVKRVLEIEKGEVNASNGDS